jgi:hypothetical protein
LAYAIYAEITDPRTGRLERGTGTFQATAENRREALEKAKDLRQQGFTVTINAPDGKSVDEDEESDD